MINTGLRAEVTGGRHLDELQLLLVEILVDAGIPPELMEVKKRPVPGYCRRDNRREADDTCLHRPPDYGCRRPMVEATTSGKLGDAH